MGGRTRLRNDQCVLSRITELVYGNERNISTYEWEYAPDPELLGGDENLESHVADYSIGRDVIYAAFSWSVVEEAYELMRSLAQKHKVGFFDVSANDGDIILPDGTMIV